MAYVISCRSREAVVYLFM